MITFHLDDEQTKYAVLATGLKIGREEGNGADFLVGTLTNQDRDAVHANEVWFLP